VYYDDRGNAVSQQYVEKVYSYRPLAHIEQESWNQEFDYLISEAIYGTISDGDFDRNQYGQSVYQGVYFRYEAHYVHTQNPFIEHIKNDGVHTVAAHLPQGTFYYSFSVRKREGFYLPDNPGYKNMVYRFVAQRDELQPDIDPRYFKSAPIIQNDQYNPPPVYTNPPQPSNQQQQAPVYIYPQGVVPSQQQVYVYPQSTPQQQVYVYPPQNTPQPVYVYPQNTPQVMQQQVYPPQRW
jgi:hypothetical protein